MTKLTLIAIAILSSNVLLAQYPLGLKFSSIDMKEQQLVSENSRLMQEEMLIEADILANELLKRNPKSSNYNYRKGFAVLYAYQKYDIAKLHLEIATKNTRGNYDAFSKNELAAPHDALFHLAVCEHNLGNYDEAEQLFHQFKSISRKESELIGTLELKYIQLNNARNHFVSSSDIPVKLDGINTAYDDYCPLISADGNALYFTSRRKSIEEKFGVKYPDNTFFVQLNKASTPTIDAVNFGHTNKNESLVFASLNQRFLIYYSDAEGNGDLFHKNNMENSYTIPAVNTEYWEPHAFLTNDGKTFYFVSDRLGGYGGRDIYQCTFENEKWSEPLNLGPTINSKYDEDAPFLSIDGKTLYFSSNGEKSIGGFDIFYSQFSNNEWSKPMNLGAPYNSPSDDIFYTTTSDGKTAYFSSNRKDSEGRLDIYKMSAPAHPKTQIAVFKGLIKTKDGKSLPEDVALALQLTCLDCVDPKPEKMALYPNLTDGLILQAVEPCKSYQVVFNNGNEKFDEVSFTTRCDLDYQEISREFIYDLTAKRFLTPEKEIEVVSPVFANVRFKALLDYNKTKVSEDDLELSQAIAALEKQIRDGRENITLSIHSSASTVPTRKFGNNQQLAAARAKDLQNTLEQLIRSNELLNGKVQVKIGSSTVNGPAYEKDAANKDKYKPYQYLSFETN
jgi:YHS domain-containing protein